MIFSVVQQCSQQHHKTGAGIMDYGAGRRVQHAEDRKRDGNKVVTIFPSS